MIIEKDTPYIHPIKIAITSAIGLVWLINGLFCKVLNLVPRHTLIVGRILGTENAVMLTGTIGMLEILMVVWIISGIKTRWCTWFQISIVAAMNVIEFILVPDLLLFGRWNILVAAIFISFLYVQEFVLFRSKIMPVDQPE